MTKSKRSVARFVARGPVILTGDPTSPGRRELPFGGPIPDGPLPGHILVLLSRLHRAETAPPDSREQPRP